MADVKNRNAYVLCLSTVDNSKQAERIAKQLVGKKLVACVNIIPQVISIYSWKNKVEKSGEWILVMKTKKSLLPALEKELLSLHPYDVPEFIVMPITAGNKKYLKWISDVTA